MEIPALTLWQPWASLVFLGLKKYETRSWGTPYRGQMWIHAAKRKVDWRAVQVLQALDIPVPELFDFPLGCLIGVVNLTAVQLMVTDERYEKTRLIYRDGIARISDQPVKEIAVGVWEPGRYAWKLEAAEQLDYPIYIRGQQGLWYPK
ncbi:MAG TPA: hypothetical protein DCY88_07895 [Cyanobacteria bacterium UBA11372]|nr:hypothetical protein [Cyanobacteria bacterium UBA11372]